MTLCIGTLTERKKLKDGSTWRVHSRQQTIGFILIPKPVLPCSHPLMQSPAEISALPTEPSVLPTILSIQVFGDLIIIIDKVLLRVWVRGINQHLCLGVLSSPIMTEPIMTPIQLNPGDYIIKAHNHFNLCAILIGNPNETSKRLYISRVLLPSMFPNTSSTDLKDTDGLYTNLPTESKHPFQYLLRSEQQTPRLRSVEFACQPGFFEPLIVDQVAFDEETIFFEIGSKHYMFNSQLIIADTVRSSSLIKLSPILHDYRLVYYRIRLPFKPVVKYYPNFLYMSYGSKHHVLSASPDVDLSPLTWLYFKKKDFNADSIILNSRDLAFAVVADNILYEYNEIKGKLTPSEGHTDNSKALILNRNSTDPQIGFMNGSGILANYLGFAQAGPIEPIDRVVGANKDLSIIVVDSESSENYADDGNTLTINNRFTDWYSIAPHGVFTYSQEQGLRYCTRIYDSAPSDMEPIIAGSEFTIFERIDTLEPITSVCASSMMIVYQTVSGSCYFYRFSEISHMEPQLIVLSGSHTPSIDHSLVDHLQLDILARAHAKIKERDNKLRKFCRIAAGIPDYPCGLSVTYVSKKGNVKAHGDAIRCDFSLEALWQFRDAFLIQHENHTEFNLRTLKRTSQRFRIRLGRMLRLAMAMIEGPLPIRLPIPFHAHLLRRKPTVTELEFFVSRSYPELLEQMNDYKCNPEALANCGYDTYREFLEAVVCYTSIDDNANKTAHIICEDLVTGFLGYAPIANLGYMDYLTLDYVLSGLCAIDRNLFKKLIRGPLWLVKLLHNLIDTATEEQLQVLLKNWSGVPILRNKVFDVQISDDELGVHFHACCQTVVIPTCFFEPSAILDSVDPKKRTALTPAHFFGPNTVIDSVDELYAALTLPLNHISDRQVIIKGDQAVDTDPHPSVPLQEIPSMIQVYIHRPSTSMIPEPEPNISDSRQEINDMIAELKKDD